MASTSNHYQTGPAGIALIKRFEGCRLKAYRCPADVWTIGYGHTRDVYRGQEITQAGAERLLQEDLRAFEADVNELVQVLISQDQFDALVSFTFNLGPDIDADHIAEGLGDSTLLRKLNAGDFDGAANEFPKWCHAGGRKLAGLVRRRAAERALFLKGC